MNNNKMITLQKIANSYQTMTPKKIAILILLLLVAYFAYLKYEDYLAEEKQTLDIVSNPQINDIYFLDFRVLSEKLRPKEKYRIAKIVDVTGDVITLLYGGFYYHRQHAVINSIKYGQLSFKNYFETKRYNIHIDKIKDMQNNQAIYLAKRPVGNKLYGSLVGPEKEKEATNYLIYGTKENIKGKILLRDKFSETSLKEAFDLFQRASNFGFAKSQVNLAEMYINAQHVEQNLDKALHWLKQASLQSYEPAILKYVIVCKQVKYCSVNDFYQELTTEGVSIKVRELDFELSE